MAVISKEPNPAAHIYTEYWVYIYTFEQLCYPSPKMTDNTYDLVQYCYSNIAKNTRQHDSQEKIATAFGCFPGSPQSRTDRTGDWD